MNAFGKRVVVSRCQSSIFPVAERLDPSLFDDSVLGKSVSYRAYHGYLVFQRNTSNMNTHNEHWSLFWALNQLQRSHALRHACLESYMTQLIKHLFQQRFYQTPNTSKQRLTPGSDPVLGLNWGIFFRSKIQQNPAIFSHVYTTSLSQPRFQQHIYASYFFQNGVLLYFSFARKIFTSRNDS